MEQTVASKNTSLYLKFPTTLNYTDLGVVYEGMEGWTDEGTDGWRDRHLKFNTLSGVYSMIAIKII